MSKIKQPSSRAQRRSKVRPTCNNKRQSSAKYRRNQISNLYVPLISNPDKAIHICSISVFENVINRAIQHDIEFNYLEEAVLQEIKLPSTEEEKDKYNKAIVYDFKGLVDEFTAAVGIISYLACNQKVVKSILETYAQEKTFGIVVKFIQEGNELDVQCMPVYFWYDYVAKLLYTTKFENENESSSSS